MTFYVFIFRLSSVKKNILFHYAIFSELIISNMFSIKFISDMPFNLACLIGANLVRLH